MIMPTAYIICRLKNLGFQLPGTRILFLWSKRFGWLAQLDVLFSQLTFLV